MQAECVQFRSCSSRFHMSRPESFMMSVLVSDSFLVTADVCACLK